MSALANGLGLARDVLQFAKHLTGKKARKRRREYWDDFRRELAEKRRREERARREGL
jgi:hypothetical protein